MPTIAILRRGRPDERGAPLEPSSRLHPVADALRAAGFDVRPIVYCEEASDAVAAELALCAGVLAWVDPLSDGRNRRDLDALLRRAAAAGVWIGSHPDVIAKMGTKEVLFDTQALGWCGAVMLYRDVAAFRDGFPRRLAEAGVKVLKRVRGNGGQGVWKVTLTGAGTVRLQEATHRDGSAQTTALEDFLARCVSYFDDGGRLIEQDFQPRIVDGMVRCYLCGGRLVGFARQFPAGHGGTVPVEDTFGLPAAKTMLPPEAPALQALRAMLERRWVPGMQRLLAIADDALPALWDADFLFGPRDAQGADSFVLCEINASCITPFPPEMPDAIAARVTAALAARRAG